MLQNSVNSTPIKIGIILAQPVMFCPLSHFVNLVHIENYVIDGAGVIRSWVTVFIIKVWEYELGGFNGGLRLLWNVSGIADYLKGIEREFNGPEPLLGKRHSSLCV